MQYGAMNFPVMDVCNEIEKIAGLGFDYVELTLDPPSAHFKTVLKSREAIIERLSHHNLGLVCHLPTFVYAADLTDSIREASIQELIGSLDAAASLGAAKAVLHPPCIPGLGGFVMTESRQRGFESLEIIVESARKKGVRLCLENMFPAYRWFFDTKDFDEAFRLFPDLGMTLDTGHANLCKPRGKLIRELVEHFQGRIEHIHVSDNFGKRDDHLALGRAGIDFKRFVKDLHRIGYTGTITLEIFSDDPKDLAQSRDTLELLIRKSIAFND